MFRIIDSHCHLHDQRFLEDLSKVLQRAEEAQISHMVTIGCDIETTKNAMKIAEKIPQVYFTAGFHPHESKFLSIENKKLLEEFAKHKKCVGIGECGLDYYYLHSSKDEQKEAFIAQIELAQITNLPLIIHLRDAFTDCCEILEKYLEKNQKVVIHCFSGSLKEANYFANSGFFISISGIITFKKPGELLEVVKKIPLDKLLVETDSPYLAPEPYRGKRNEPAFIINILNTIAKTRGENLEQVSEQVFENTKYFFGIS